MIRPEQDIAYIRHSIGQAIALYFVVFDPARSITTSIANYKNSHCLHTVRKSRLLIKYRLSPTCTLHYCKRGTHRPLNTSYSHGMHRIYRNNPRSSASLAHSTTRKENVACDWKCFHHGQKGAWD